MAARSSSPSRTGSGSPASPGPICCARPGGGGWPRRCSPSAMGRWGSGLRCARCFPTPANNAAGSTKPRTCSTPCQVRAPGGEGGAGRDLQRRRRRACTYGGHRVRGRLRCEVAQGGRKITEDLDVLLEFYTYPAEHWVHLRTTNPIESTFATVRLRQRITKGPGSRAAGVAMAFKLIESAQQRWRAVNAPHLVPLVRAGARFEKGKLVERPDDQGGEQQVA